jgi:hypothetical protein
LLGLKPPNRLLLTLGLFTALEALAFLLRLASGRHQQESQGD